MKTVTARFSGRWCKKLLRSLRPFRKAYIAGITLGIGFVLLDMQGPQFIKAISDYGLDYVAGKDPGVSVAAASRHVATIIGWWALVFAGSVVLQRYSHPHHHPRRRKRAVPVPRTHLRASCSGSP